MHVNDEGRMEHIRQAALEARKLMCDATRLDLDTDHKLSLAVVRLPEIISKN